LRKLIRRVRAITQTQFIGSMQIIETLQESVQGIRMVKAFALEEEMRRRFAVSVEAVERFSNKMARVGIRASPMMQTLGGFAVALAILYGGYRVIETGATPGAFVSFSAAFLLAYEPAKRPGAPQYRPQQRSGWRAHALRGHRQSGGRADGRPPTAVCVDGGTG